MGSPVSEPPLERLCHTAASGARHVLQTGHFLSDTCRRTLGISLRRPVEPTCGRLWFLPAILKANDTRKVARREPARAPHFNSTGVAVCDRQVVQVDTGDSTLSCCDRRVEALVLSQLNRGPRDNRRLLCRSRSPGVVRSPRRSRRHAGHSTGAMVDARSRNDARGRRITIRRPDLERDRNRAPSWADFTMIGSGVTSSWSRATLPACCPRCPPRRSRDRERGPYERPLVERGLTRRTLGSHRHWNDATPMWRPPVEGVGPPSELSRVDHRVGRHRVDSTVVWPAVLLRCQWRATQGMFLATDREGEARAAVPGRDGL
jgi:hypothetical protein